MPDSNRSRRTEKIQIMLDDDELSAIDDWRFANRVPSRAAAIRELLRRGIAKSSDFDPPPTDAASGDFRVTAENGDE